MKPPLWIQNLAFGYWDGLKTSPTGAWWLTFAVVLLITWRWF